MKVLCLYLQKDKSKEQVAYDTLKNAQQGVRDL